MENFTVIGASPLITLIGFAAVCVTIVGSKLAELIYPRGWR